MFYAEYNPNLDQDASTFSYCNSMSIGQWLFVVCVYFSKFFTEVNLLFAW